jgi:hypothetical protein
LKNYTKRKNRRRRRIRERAKRRRDKLEFIGTCSNCRKKNQLVRRIAGGQVCFSCAKKLPGHLLRKVFPMVQDPGLTKFLREHQIVGTTAVDRPGEPDPPAKGKMTWAKRKLAELGNRIRRLGRRRTP